MVMMMVMRLMIVVMLIVRVIMTVGPFLFRVDVDCAGVYPKFDPRNPFALLAFEMQMMVFEGDLAQFPFEHRWRDSKIGQRADKHVATDPGEAVQVENPHCSQ